MSIFAETDRAILKIAYAILALDGKITDDELISFRKVAEGFPGFEAGAEATNNLLTEAIAVGDRLITFRKIYSDDEMLKALRSCTHKDCYVIMQSKSASKKAFIIWIAMALADHNYSSIERNAIKAFQATFNPQNIFAQFFTACVPGGIIENLLQKNISATKSSCDMSLTISDSFLEEVEDILKTIAEIKTQMKKSDGARLAELQKSCDEQTDLLKDKILSEEN